MSGQSGFWDFEDRLAELSAEGDPLEKLSATVDFEMFRPLLRAQPKIKLSDFSGL